jgi:alkyl hydroperoxide reductase subunit AhpC
MCRQQLVDFTSIADKFREADIGLMAGSADDLEHAKAFVEELKIPFPVAYGLNAKEVSQKTGAFYDADEGYLHATGFVINPEGTIVNGVYSTMAIGRLVAKDCLGLVAHLREG